MQAAACTRFRSHTCGLRRVFSDVHAAGKNDLHSFRRLRAAELCEAFVKRSLFRKKGLPQTVRQPFWMISYVCGMFTMSRVTGVV